MTLLGRFSKTSSELFLVDLGLGKSCLNIKDMPTLMDMDINWEKEELDRIVQIMEVGGGAKETGGGVHHHL
jgi:hypothetical protein